MIFQSFLLDNLISLCMKIMNSLVLIGLYYGFLTTFSIGPSYLFLIQARVMEEETEKKISATTGFITGQLMMFISIYYVPFHLALGRPHTITAIAILYLFFQLLGNSNKNLFNYGYKNRNLIRNFSIQNIFFKNLIFQLLNPFFLPSSMLIRLVNIYLFRYNSKLLFLTSSFIGWLIGHIFLMKWIELIFIWIQQKNSMIKSIRKYIMLELRNYTSDIYEIFFFFSRYETILVSLSVIFLYYSGKTPAPFLIVEIQEMNQIEKKNVEQTAGTKQKRSTKNEQNLYKINKKKNSFGFVEKPLINTLFNYKQWNRPNRYIKNHQFEDVIRNETSEFFFHTCQSDGKERISFTYPQNLSTFHKMMETKMDFFTREKIFYDELSNYWNDTNKEKTSKLSNEFLNRAKALDTKFIPLDIFENRIKLSNDIKTKTKYLPKIYDPFLNGPFRGRIQNCFSPSIKNEKTYKKNDIFINKIYGILFYNINSSNYPEFEQKINTFDRKSLVNEFLFDAIRTDLSNKTIVNRKKKKCIGINEISKKVNELSKKVPLWSYKFIDEIQQLESEGGASDFHILSREIKRDLIFTQYLENDNTDENTIATKNTKKNEKEKIEYALIRYLQEPDFDRDIIKGSIRAQRRKITILKFFQTLHSPLFLDKSEKSLLFSFDDFESIKIFFMDWMGKKTESDYTEEKKESEKEEDEIRKMIAEREEEKKNKERQYKIISEAWDSLDQEGNGQLIRGCLLIIQWILRKYIIFPSLIITKNIVRMLFFQSPEWSEDYRDWENEVYIICTYDGVPLAEFPNKWVTDGFQVRVLYPFRLKPWHRSKLRSTEKEKDRMKKKKKVKKTNFGFLTVYGAVVEAPFAAPSEDLLSSLISFLNPIFKELKKKYKNSFFLVSKVLNERTKLFLKKKPLLFHFNSLFLSRFKKINELSERKKNSTIWKNNPMIFESTIPIESINLENYSLILKKIKNDLNVKTTIIRKQVEQMIQEEEIEKMRKEEKKKGRLLNSKIDIYPSKTIPNTTRFKLEITIIPNKTTSNTKRLELGKNILDILHRLQRRTVRLTRKCYSFFKIFIQRVYIDIFLYIISIPRINIQLFLESIYIYISKSIYNNEINGERTDKTNQKSIINFISIIHKSYTTGNKRNRNSQNSCDVSFLSQAYVFLKLSQTEVINTYKYKLRSVFQYHERFFFLKNEIKDSFFGVQKISHSNLKHKNFPNSLMNQWTNWLKGHYQYDLSQNRWSRLVPQKWRKRINEHHMSQNKDLTKCDSYEKPRLILYKDYKEQQVDALKKTKIKKQYGYDLLSYNSINYADNTDLYIYGYRSSFQTNIKRTNYSNYNTNKKKLFDTMNNISIKHYVEEDAILDMEKNLNRKYFDWIGINVEILNRSISNPKFWFFLEFMIFHNAYRINPWIIPIKLLFFHFNGNPNVIQNKNKIFRPSKIKKSPEFELETRKSSLSNQEKDIQEDLKNIEDIKKDLEEFDNKKVGIGKSKNNKKGGKSKKKSEDQLELQLGLLLKDFVNLHLDWKNSFGSEIYQNIKIYGLLTKLKNFKKVKRLAIASIRREELDLDIPMMDNEMIITFRKKKTMKKGFMIIEPVRLSRRNNKEFFLYQTISISLIHKNKRKIHQGYSEKKEKKNYDLLVPENILSTRRRRELRILMCLNSRNRNSIQNRNTNLDNENKVNNCFEVLTKKIKDRDIDKKKLMNLKIFVWPNYRLEDLACINRYWFNTYNGSRFSIIRLYMYPRLKNR
uniref:hypothetical protein Ycf1 n=1 Tax=Cleobulia coccinea TaxID=2983343 RepID=UPI0021FCE3A0|nr:hypothetical protein Ycf1 [Cleobulia coccinea]UXL85086.1 hypothetical protein Ycf1 [Cleobulia coccinea]